LAFKYQSPAITENMQQSVSDEMTPVSNTPCTFGLVSSGNC